MAEKMWRMSRLFRDLKGRLSRERRESIEVRAQTILLSTTSKHCSEPDTLADLPEQEIDQIVVAQANDDVAWEKPILIQRTGPILPTIRLNEPTSAEDLESF
jgi:hypothetical protein